MIRRHDDQIRAAPWKPWPPNSNKLSAISRSPDCWRSVQANASPQRCQVLTKLINLVNSCWFSYCSKLNPFYVSLVNPLYKTISIFVFMFLPIHERCRPWIWSSLITNRINKIELVVFSMIINIVHNTYSVLREIGIIVLD